MLSESKTLAFGRGLSERETLAVGRVLPELETFGVGCSLLVLKTLGVGRAILALETSCLGRELSECETLGVGCTLLVLKTFGVGCALLDEVRIICDGCRSSVLGERRSTWACRELLCRPDDLASKSAAGTAISAVTINSNIILPLPIIHLLTYLRSFAGLARRHVIL